MHVPAHLYRAARMAAVSILKPVVVEALFHIKQHRQGGKQERILHDVARNDTGKSHQMN
jgi:hypothetical protein